MGIEKMRMRLYVCLQISQVPKLEIGEGDDGDESYYRRKKELVLCGRK